MQEKRICEACGKEFVATNGMQRFCKGPHYRTCVVCGQQFEVPPSRLGEADCRKTCSKKCSIALRKSTNEKMYGGPSPSSSKEVRQKIKETNIDRYGTTAPAQNSEILDKIKNTNRKKYGTDFVLGSKKVREKIAKTNLSKYGSVSPMASSIVKKKAVATNMLKYNATNPMKNEDFKKEFFRKYKAKTGYNAPFSNPDVVDKSRSTLVKNYGVLHPLQNKELQRRAVETSMLKYGTENPMQNDEVKLRAQASNLERYGVENPMQNDEIKSKVHQSMKNKYDVAVFSKSAEWKLRRMKDPSKIERLMRFDQDPSTFILEEFDTTPSLIEVADYCGVGTEAISTRLAKSGCQNLVAYVRSTMEREVSQFITSLSPDIVIEHDCRKIITPYEIDLYLPEYKIGIECNPTSTHNSTLNSWDTDADPTPPSYHKRKSDMCERKGVFLFHIFGYEWEYRQNIIKSMLSNLLGFNAYKLYARNTEVRGVSSAQAQNFLEENHRQGKANSVVRLGLFHKGELVSLMTFGKLRHTIGKDVKEDPEKCWELMRFCNKLNTSVCGGASKLFKHFIKNYNPIYIRSYSDRAHTRGHLYTCLGFEQISRSDPNYLWIDMYSEKPYHRINAQKRNLRRFLKDESIDLANMTEREIMINHGYVQVYDSGTILWEWRS